MKTKDFHQTIKNMMQTLDQFKLDLRLCATKDEVDRKVKVLSNNVETKFKSYPTTKLLDKRIEKLTNELATQDDKL